VRESQAALKGLDFDAASDREYREMRRQVLVALAQPRGPRRIGVWKPALAAASLVVIAAALFLMGGGSGPRGAVSHAPGLPSTPPVAQSPAQTSGLPASMNDGPQPVAAQDMVIKLVTGNPDIVIFWLTNGNAKEDRKNDSTA